MSFRESYVILGKPCRIEKVGIFLNQLRCYVDDMYKSRICRTTPKSHTQFFIRRSESAFDERVRYVESVCQVLIESRFGACFVEPVIIDLSERPELEPVVFSDLLDELNGLVPCYFMSLQGRNGYQVIEAAYRRAKQMGLLDSAPNAHNSTTALTPNQGRGSP